MLVIDAGNSKVKIAIFKDERIVKKEILDKERCLEKGFLRRKVFKENEEDIIAFSSVVPVITEGIISLSQKMKKKYFNVCKAKNTILKINYAVEQLGGDRLANAVAAYRKYSSPLLVIDFGTATTYNVVLRDGTFDGGIIAPGIKTCIDFLIQNSGLLPDILLKSPGTFLGHNTEESLISGFYYTFTGQMKEVFLNVKEHIGNEYKTIGTGGLIDYACLAFPNITPDKNLTLLGIKMLYEANN